MSDAFLTVLAYTPWVSALIIGLLIIRKIFSDKISPSFFRMAWLVLALRMVFLFDVSFEQAPITFEIPTQIKVSVQEPANLSAAAPPTAIAPDNTAPNYIKRQVNYGKLFAIIWVTGAACYLSISIFSYLSYTENLKRKRKILNGGAVFNSVDGALPLYESSEISSPILCGYLNPSIYIMHNEYSEIEANSIAKHELLHHKRHDLWLQLLLLFAASVCWFNPFVHIMRKTALYDIELSCDEVLLKGTSLSQRKEYGETLLNSIRTQGKVCTLATEYSGKENIMKRFKEILNLRPKIKGKVLILLICAACATFSTLVACKQETPKSTSNPSISVAQTLPQSEPTSTSKQPLDEASQIRPEGEIEEDSLEKVSNKNDVWSTIENGTDKPLQIVIPVPDVHISRAFGNGHMGVDFAAPRGTDIVAAATGTVSEVFNGIVDTENEKEKTLTYGIYVEIDHGNGVTTRYAQCAEVLVNVGDEIEQGKVIAKVGNTGKSTGNHCHFEVLVNDISVEFDFEEQ